MKILIICNCSTGLETFRGMLIKELVKKGNDIEVIVPFSDEKKEIEAELRIKKMNCSLKEIFIDRRGMNPLKDLKLFSDIYSNIKKMLPDLVITYTIKPNIYGGMACRLLKIPYVVNITGLGTAFQNNGVLRQMVTQMYKIALKKAELIFFENLENRDIFIDDNIVSIERTHVLAGAGVDLEYFRYLKYPPNDTLIHFLFVGRVMREKGVNELFGAIKRLRNAGYNCELDVLGGFEENYASIIKQYTEEGWLHYKGYQDDIRPFIKVAHCCVLPSWHEGMANTNLENAASGRPIITTDIHGCKEAVVNEVSGLLVEKNNVNDLYDKMLRFIEMPYEEKKKMGIAGRKLMETNFDKRKVVQETIEKINNCQIS